MLQEPRNGLLLGPAAGEDRTGPAAAVHREVRDGKAGGLPHPGEDRDVPVRAADGGMDRVQAGDHPLVSAEADEEVPPPVTADGKALQHGLVVHGLPKLVQGQPLLGEGEGALGQIFVPAQAIHRPIFFV